MKLPKLGKPSKDFIKSYFWPVYFGAPDDGVIASLMKVASERVRPGYHFADNLFTWGKNNSMLEDAHFMEVWERALDTKADKTILWRRYILACAAHHCVQLDGDFVECGCYKGTGVKTVVDYLGGPEFPKPFWGYDLFDADPNVDAVKMPDHSADLFEAVKAKFIDYPRVRIIKGRIPEILAEQSPKKISYLHIDLNHAESEIAALDALFDRLVPAGMLILDDYEWAMNYRGQKLAEDPWFEERNYRVMPLPTGQGLVIKR